MLLSWFNNSWITRLTGFIDFELSQDVHHYGGPFAPCKIYILTIQYFFIKKNWNRLPFERNNFFSNFFPKAVDAVSRLYNVLQLLGCPETLLFILQAFHENINALTAFCLQLFQFAEHSNRAGFDAVRHLFTSSRPRFGRGRSHAQHLAVTGCF